MTQNQSSQYNFSDISVVMGAKDEEKAIPAVIEEINESTKGKAEIIVVNGSSDNTGSIAREMGATVINQDPQGYGIALLKGLKSATREVIITTDCDGTYPMSDIPRFLDKINEGYDVVGGIRLKGMKTPNMKPLNILGNYLFVLLVTVLYGKRIHDTTTGMRAYRRSVIEEIDWKENTGLSAELLFKPVMLGYNVTELPIEYRSRLGSTKLDPLRGGSEIFYSIIRYKLPKFLLISLLILVPIVFLVFEVLN